MKKPLFCGFVILLFLLSSNLQAQQRFRTVELKPIHKDGWRYFYDGKRVNTPYALQIPLSSVNDEEVTKRYKQFTFLSNAGQFLAIVPLVYLIGGVTNSGNIYNPETFFWMVIAIFGIDITLDIVAHSQLKKGIDRYNILILTPSQGAPGLSLRYKF
ncbi:MAG: hypothetical protein KF687_05260 [Cyclobacteriaceae bacterium]|nr:hypothetical protein [Cyclobacteriaceae bacterium]